MINGFKNRTLGLLIFILMGIINGFAQDALTFKTVDEQTYRAYINKDWKTVTSIGNQALKVGIDYYYLEMRMGIAYFEMNNFGKAIKHFEKVREFNAEDVVATEYLFYAYQYLDNDIQAMRTLNRSSSTFASQLLSEQKLFENIYAFYSSRFYSANAIETALLPAFQKEINKVQTPIYVETFVPETYNNYQIGATLRFSPSWRIDASYQNFQIKRSQIILDPFQKKETESATKQVQWNFNNSFSLGQHFQGKLFLTYLSNTSNFTEINTDQVPVEYKPISNVKSSDLLLGISLKRHQTYFNLEGSFNFLTTADQPATQFDLNLEILPFGNRKWFSRSQYSFLNNGNKGAYSIFTQSISYRPWERFQVSLTSHWGTIQNWQTNYGYAVYNGIHPIQSIYQTMMSMRLYKKVYFKLYYEFMVSNAEIFSESLIPSNSKNETPKTIESIKFNTHSMIGGFIWEF